MDSVVAEPVSSPRVASEYSELRDVRLAALLTAEDGDERFGRMTSHERLTCRTHRRWAHQCISSPLHVIVVTGHRWCTTCRVAVDIAVDELTGTVAMRCPRCSRTPEAMVNRQTMRACRRSVEMARLRDCGPARRHQL